jgi:hypothetical protein
MQLIHDAGAHLYQSMPMPQQLPQIPILCVRDPDPWKAIFYQKLQQQLRILTTVLAKYPQIANGIDLRTVQSYLGHSDLQSTMRYLKSSRSAEARQKMNEVFAGTKF